MVANIAPCCLSSVVALFRVSLRVLHMAVCKCSYGDEDFQDGEAFQSDARPGQLRDEPNATAPLAVTPCGGGRSVEAAGPAEAAVGAHTAASATIRPQRRTISAVGKGWPREEWASRLKSSDGLLVTVVLDKRTRNGMRD